MSIELYSVSIKLSSYTIILMYILKCVDKLFKKVKMISIDNINPRI